MIRTGAPSSLNPVVDGGSFMRSRIAAPSRVLGTPFHCAISIAGGGIGLSVLLGCIIVLSLWS